MGFFASKVLLSAVELKLFTILARAPATSQELVQSLAHDVQTRIVRR